MTIVRFRQTAARPASPKEVGGTPAPRPSLGASPSAFADLGVVEWRRIALAPSRGEGGELLVAVAHEAVDGLQLRSRAVSSGAFGLPPAVAVLASLPSEAEGSPALDADAARSTALAAGRYFPYQAPASKLQRELVCALETATGFSPLGITDDFFCLGVDSLVAIRFAMLIEPLSSTGCSLDDIFEQGNVQRLAQRLAGGATEGSP